MDKKYFCKEIEPQLWGVGFISEGKWKRESIHFCPESGSKHANKLNQKSNG